MPKYHPRPISFDAPQENFAEYYGFDKRTQPTPREKLLGMDRWDKKYGNSEYLKECAPKEHAFKSGKAHCYSCHGSQSGKLRNSGSAKAHRIGKR